MQDPPRPELCTYVSMTVTCADDASMITLSVNTELLKDSTFRQCCSMAARRVILKVFFLQVCSYASGRMGRRRGLLAIQRRAFIPWWTAVRRRRLMISPMY